MPDWIEFCYSAVAQITEHLESLVSSIGLLLLYQSFMEKKQKLWFVGAVYFGVLVLIYYLPFYPHASGAHALAAAAAFPVLYYLERRNLYTKLYLLTVFEILRWFVAIISINAYLVSDTEMQGLIIRSVDAENRLKYFLMSFVLQQILYFLLYTVLFLLSLNLLRRCFMHMERDLNRKEFCVLLVPVLSGIATNLLRRSYIDQLDAVVNVDGRASYRVYFWECLNSVIMVGAMFLVLVLFRHLLRQQAAEREHLILAEQMKEMQSHVKTVEQIYTGIRGMRHDLGNHVQVLQGLLGQGQYEAAGDYLDTFQETVDSFGDRYKTGNPVTDVIINERAVEAEQNGINFQVNFHYPGKSAPDVFDVSVVLNNTLENAFTAVKKCKEPFVSLSSRREGNVWLIVVRNSFEGSLVLGENGLPPTDKAQEHLHGYGLKNVRAVAEKYYGAMELIQRENLVILTIMFLLP